MVGWHHQLDGYEFEQDLGVGDGQGSLVCCSPWGRKESDESPTSIKVFASRMLVRRESRLSHDSETEQHNILEKAKL